MYDDKRFPLYSEHNKQMIAKGADWLQCILHIR